MKEIKIKINGMVCEGCENRVKSVVSSINGVDEVEANHNTGIVIVKTKEDLDISQIKEKIECGIELTSIIYIPCKNAYGINKRFCFFSRK